MHIWKETPRKTQDIVEGLCLSAGLGTPWNPPRGAGKVQKCSGALLWISFCVGDHHDQFLSKLHLPDT